MGETPRSNHAPLEDSIPQASLESILCTEELQRRPSRPPDYEKENRALVRLVSALADSPRTIFQTLAETIQEITQCDSAGLSLLTKDGKTPHVDGQRFYWPAICGMWNPHVGGGTPRSFGPCGDVLDQNRALLFTHFERRYPYLMPVSPAAEECLLVPFYVGGKAVGTIWAIMHSDRRKFDAEDDRVMASVGKFASSAYQAWMHIEDLKIEVAEREKAEAELRQLTDGLEGQVQARTAELQLSEERLRLAQQAAHIGSFEWNLGTGVNTWTPELEEMYGLPPGGFGGTQKAFENLVHPDDLTGVIELAQQSLKSGQTANGEWRVVWPDGSVHWIAGRWQALMDESGTPLRVVGVNIDITERKRAEEALRASEEKFRSVFRNAGVGMVVVSPEGHFLAANKAFCDCLGYTEEELLEKTVESVTFPEDWPVFSQKLREPLAEGRGFQWLEKRCLHKSGRIVYTESSASVIRSREGDPQYLVGQVLDTTKRREAEEVLSGMSRKLIEAQEQERTRIGRELHDDINQRIAMLSLELGQLQDDPSDVRNRLQELRTQTTELSNDVQALSHELHSSKLEYLGVVSGIGSWCKEFGERQGMEIEFKSDVSGVVPFDIGSSLFRVLQEALHNALKYSGVKRIVVQLHEESGEIHLTIRDLGKGFDIEAARQGRGLGLTSMQERVRLVNGTITIESKPMGGTVIHVRVPVESEEGAQSATG